MSYCIENAVWLLLRYLVQELGVERSLIYDGLDVDFINHSISVFGKNRRKETIPITEKLELPAYQTFCNQTGEK
ncbi:hypothetical protein A4A35_19505 [Bacillus subtilis]|nr:hypothetical protein A4A35_19505 [Bacillus subtilis]OIS64648.1 hypothetical protein A4A37_20575 [Bacillus subtilis]